jgi:hypothetical protein
MGCQEEHNQNADLSTEFNGSKPYSKSSSLRSPTALDKMHPNAG